LRYRAYHIFGAQTTQVHTHFLRSARWISSFGVVILILLSPPNNGWAFRFLDARIKSRRSVSHTHSLSVVDQKMSNATIIATAFGEGADLYEILGVERDATAAQLRKAYYRKSLACHPDKVGGQEATFHALTVAYNILKDDQSRAEYDDTGELVDTDDDYNNNGDGNSFDAMKNFFSSVFGTVTTSKIDAFAEKYKCSEEEEGDVLKYYTQFKGHVGKMLENVMLSTERDAQRWMEDYLEPAIHAGRVPDYTKQLHKTLQQCLKKAEQEVDEEEDDDEEGNDMEEEEDDNDDDDATESEDSAPPRPPTRRQTTKKSKTAATVTKKTTPKKKTRKTKAQLEAEQAEALMNKIRGKASLATRKKGFDSMLSGLASKYGETMHDDPLDDDAFERIQATIVKNKEI
jgi:DnaJ family protein C protein 9